MLTKKDFIAIAANIQFTRNQSNALENASDAAWYRTGMLDTISAVADYCKISNPAFDREKFIEDCGFPLLP